MYIETMFFLLTAIFYKAYMYKTDTGTLLVDKVHVLAIKLVNMVPAIYHKMYSKLTYFNYQLTV